MTHKLEIALAAHGLAAIGVCPALPDDALPSLPGGGAARAILIAGNAGAAMWPHFAAAPEYGDARPDPLNRWSARVLGEIADAQGAGLLFPFDGPPFWPFQRWALRGGTLSQSPLGVLAHADYGLWFAFRGALLLAEEVPARAAAGGPCETCREKPCLDACPADALTRDHGFEVAPCRAHVAGTGRETCAATGCLVRHACPYGRDHAYSPEQAAFHMAAFTR